MPLSLQEPVWCVLQFGNKLNGYLCYLAFLIYKSVMVAQAGGKVGYVCVIINMEQSRIVSLWPTFRFFFSQLCCIISPFLSTQMIPPLIPQNLFGKRARGERREEKEREAQWGEEIRRRDRETDELFLVSSCESLRYSEDVGGTGTCWLWHMMPSTWSLLQTHALYVCSLAWLIKLQQISIKMENDS